MVLKGLYRLERVLPPAGLHCTDGQKNIDSLRSNESG